MRSHHFFAVFLVIFQVFSGFAGASELWSYKLLASGQIQVNVDPSLLAGKGESGVSEQLRSIEWQIMQQEGLEKHTGVLEWHYNVGRQTLREWQAANGQGPAPIPKEPPAPEHMLIYEPTVMGPLTGRKINVNPAHGWYWNGSAWVWQRPLINGYREDLGSHYLVEPLVALLRNAGAAVYVGRNENRNFGTSPRTGKPSWENATMYWAQDLGLPSWIYDNGGSGDYSKDIRSRPRFGNYYGVDIGISMHTNAGGGTGTLLIYSNTNNYVAASSQLTNRVMDGIIDSIRRDYDPTWNRFGIWASGGYGEPNQAAHPAVLIELAFHDNLAKDNPYLQDPAFRQAAAQGVYEGVLAYFGVAGSPVPTATRTRTPIPLATATPGGIVIVDNQDAGFTKYGNFAVDTTAGRSYRNHFFHCLNETSVIDWWGKWTPSGLLPGTYEVKVNIPSANASTCGARYRIRHNGQETTQVLCQNNYYNGDWPSLGTYTFAGNGDEYVYLGDATGESTQTKRVAWDAVAFHPVAPAATPTRTATPPPATATRTATVAAPSATPGAGSTVIVDNTDANFAVTGTWGTGTMATDKYGVDYRWCDVGSGSRTARWTLALGQPATVAVSAWWPAGTNRATNAPYTISQAGMTSTTVRVNQRVNGGQWNSLGTFNFSSGTVTVTLSDQGDTGVVMADAVRFSIQAAATPTATIPPPATATRTATVPPPTATRTATRTATVPPPSATPTPEGEQRAQLYVDPAQGQATIGGEVVVSIRLTPNGLPASYVGGFLGFDSTGLRYVSGEVNRAVFDNGMITADPQESVPGVLSWPAMAQSAIHEEVLVATLRFEALTQGVAELTFLSKEPSNTIVADMQFETLPADCTGGTITIGQTGTGMGDADRNGFVNGEDFRCVRDHFGQTTTGVGDANFDGFVNTDDFRAVRDNFGSAY